MNRGKWRALAWVYEAAIEGGSCWWRVGGVGGYVCVWGWVGGWLFGIVCCMFFFIIVHT